jgi:hypothetical protein
MNMHNWSTDTTKLSQYTEKYAIWKLEQLINFGLNGEKLKLSELQKYFNKLHIDPQKRDYLKFLLSFK